MSCSVATEEESLFDGETLTGWRGFRQAAPPSTWGVESGAITLAPDANRGRVDLMTDAVFDDFELTLEWAVAAGGNSGVFFRVVEDEGSAAFDSGLESQVLGDERHADGARPETSAGAIYALYAPGPYPRRGAETFHTLTIRAVGAHIDQWLNGVPVTSFDVDSDDFRTRRENSGFQNRPNLGKARSGHFVLQDHGDVVRYRNIRVRRLNP